MDAEPGVELRLDQRRADVEEHVRIGVVDVADRLVALAGDVELAPDVVVRDPGEQLVHLGLERRVARRVRGSPQAVLDRAPERAGQPGDVHQVEQGPSPGQPWRQRGDQGFQFSDRAGCVAGAVQQPPVRDAPQSQRVAVLRWGAQARQTEQVRSRVGRSAPPRLLGRAREGERHVGIRSLGRAGEVAGALLEVVR